MVFYRILLGHRWRRVVTTINNNHIHINIKNSSNTQLLETETEIETVSATGRDPTVRQNERAVRRRRVRRRGGSDGRGRRKRRARRRRIRRRVRLRGWAGWRHCWKGLMRCERGRCMIMILLELSTGAAGNVLGARCGDLRRL